MKLTKEQQSILDQLLAPVPEGEANAAGGRTFVVRAVAGAGKSMLIVEMARRNALSNILFFCQSRNIADRARGTLPANIQVRTFADAARQFLRQTRIAKGKERLVNQLSPRDVQPALPKGTTGIECRRALELLMRFYRSSHGHPQEAHLPIEDDWTQSPRDCKVVLEVARAIWFAQLIPMEEGGLPLCFDALIKWWSRSHVQSVYYPELQRQATVAPIPSDVDLIVVEEAQLLHPGLVDFLSRQRTSIVFFGDPYQALQPGSTHARPPVFDRSDIVGLEESFRFGPSIASLCSAMLHKAGGERRDPVRGLGRSAVYDARRRAIWERKEQHYTLLAAHSVTLFQEALEATRCGKTVAWINGLASHPIVLLRDLAVLSIGRERGYRNESARHLIETPSLRNVPSLGVLLERYRDQPYHPIYQLGQWVYHLEEPNLLRIVDGWRQADDARQHHFTRQLSTPLPRHLTLGTVFQAQGHEWPRIALAEDLFPMSICGHNWTADPRSRRSLNLAYTAISRAQRGLAVPAMVLAHLNAHGWELPNDSPDVEIDNSGEGLEQRHSHFGIDRHARLELTPDVRRLHVMRGKPRGVSTRQSGQTQIRERMEQAAKQLKTTGPADLRAALRQR